MRALVATALRAAWVRYRPGRRGMSEREWLAFHYPHLNPDLPWTDGTS